MLDKVNPEVLYAFDIREAEERQKNSARTFVPQVKMPGIRGCPFRNFLKKKS